MGTHTSSTGRAPAPRFARDSSGFLGVLALLTVFMVPGCPAVASADPEDDEANVFLPLRLDQDPQALAPAAKEESTLPWRTFELILGVDYASATTTINLNRSHRSGSLDIEAEGVLGMSRELLSPWVWAAYRLGERHRLQFSFEDLSRSATRDIQRDITVGDQTYPVGTSVHSELGLQYYALTYIWSFLQDDRMEIGLTFSVDVLRTHVKINIENPPAVNNDRWTLPVPLPGFHADFVLAKDLWLRQRLDFMYIPIQSYAGLFMDFNMSLEWSFIKNLAAGVGFDLKRIDLESNSNSTSLGSFDGQLKFNTAGLLFYLNLHF